MAKGKKSNKKIPVGTKKRLKLKSGKSHVAAAFTYYNAGDMPLGSPDVRGAKD